MSMPIQEEIYLLGRQPILNRQEELVAYELLFRCAASNTADVKDASQATASVIINTLTAFGLEEILGTHKGFINVELELLMGDELDILPKDQVVLELLESLEVTPELVERCRYLKESGFTLALDDHEYSPLYHELYEIVEIVKVDLVLTPHSQLEEMVKQFRRFPLQLLAEKVETKEEFQLCIDLGFDLFQGYYFSKPALMEKKRMDDSGTTILKIMRLLSEDAELIKIEKAFGSNAGLTYKLLMLVNSVGIGSRSKISTLRHAISMLGRQQIKYWIQLALFAGNNYQGLENPLVDMAAVRAGLMGNMADYHSCLKMDSEAGEKAFMTGILSILEMVYDIPPDEIVHNLNLSEDIMEALTTRKGPLGQLLLTAELLEKLDFEHVGSSLDEMGITADELLESQKSAYAWRKGLT